MLASPVVLCWSALCVGPALLLAAMAAGCPRPPM